MLDHKDIMVPTRDGARIAVRVYRPEGPGPFPTLYASSPYRYDNNDLPASAMFRWRETGPIDWYVEQQGYAYVHSDVRGTGMSEGEFGLLDLAEQRAHYDVIEWIAAQPWSNGKVGGIGQSYYCMSQWFMAIQNPPHLACIGAYDGMVDPYNAAAYSGGIEKTWLSSWFNSSIRIANLFPTNGATPRELPRDIGYEGLHHPLYDDYWRERAALEHIDKITVPVFSIAIWAKMELHLLGNILAHMRLNSDKRLFISATASNLTAVMDFNSVAYHQEFLLPFYDHYLKGLETSYTARPPVEWGVRNAGQRRTATSWPPPDAVKRTLFLAAGPTGSVTSLNDGALAEAPAAGDSASTAYTYPDPDWAIGIATAGPGAPDPVRRVLTFTSAPLAEDLELAGTAKLELYLASTCKDTDVIVRLSEQLPQSEAERAAGVQPAATIVTKGWHRASHQGKDPLHSTDDWPLYTHTERTFLTPGEITRIEVALMPMGYLFKKGSRIRLELANHDSLVTDKHFHHYYAPSKIGTDTIHHDQVYPSSLTLPVLAGG